MRCFSLSVHVRNAAMSAMLLLALQHLSSEAGAGSGFDFAPSPPAITLVSSGDSCEDAQCASLGLPSASLSARPKPRPQELSSYID